MIKTWRWFDKKDGVSLSDIREIDVNKVVSSLTQVPYGALWTNELIKEKQEYIKSQGCEWHIVESIPVHEDIKTRTGHYKFYIENYKKSLENLASAGISIVCYNFMPLMDWSRTDLNRRLEKGVYTISFDFIAFIAFDLFILKRKEAHNDYTPEENIKALQYFEKMTADEIAQLTSNIIDNLPGTNEGYSLDEFKVSLNKYEDIDAKKLKEHLALFLQEVIPVAEKNGIKMCIHPDDPPFSLLGLPRIVSNQEDIQYIYDAVDSSSNGLTFCSGSLGVIESNNLPAIFKAFADRIHFIHLRSTQRETGRSFYEANHLTGDVDMYELVKLILVEEKRRFEAGRTDHQIPMRPDHGYLMNSDVGKKFYPGYGFIGRMKGLAELTGLELGIKKSLNL